MEAVKLVVRFANGGIDKGYSQDFFPNKPIFHLFKNLSKGAADQKKVSLSDLKAVFFVKTFSGNPEYKERKSFLEGDRVQGRKAEVTFVDGEVLQGSVLGYDPRGSGFFLFPFDPKSNNQRVFAVNSAVKSFTYLQEEMKPKPPGDDYRCLIPETCGKLLMVTDEERILLRVVLSKVMETDSGRQYIVEKLGNSYLQIASELLKQMESS
ncbi:MAG: DUF6982 domain-containing protein [Deltaproteobacteria bacterium]